MTPEHRELVRKRAAAGDRNARYVDLLLSSREAGLSRQMTTDEIAAMYCTIHRAWKCKEQHSGEPRKQNLSVGQRVRHVGFGAIGTITRWDENFEVWFVTLDQPLPRSGAEPLRELSGTTRCLELVAEKAS